ncbi:MAG TPA: hypothetical protein VF190_00835, partial [Rhodothermales bacterium]
WTWSWVGTLALATFGPAKLWESTALTWLAILLNLAMGAMMILANIRYLKSLDELMQRIQLQALGLGLGVGVVGGMSYSLLDLSNLIESDAEIAIVAVLMGLTYLGATIVMHWRYR